ncbi:hypothetical protein tb265_49860 [Gemmatimonadetes bacterium T265]|nr:hypothetical protein tb265_49860 [Gemmatimonadetes bacterium T265]
MSQSFAASPVRDPRLQQVLDRAATDPHFRERLLTAPHEAIRETFGVEIPVSFRIKFIERGVDVDALIVLPGIARPVVAPDGERDDASLDAVAGGASDPDRVGPAGGVDPAGWTGTGWS